MDMGAAVRKGVLVQVRKACFAQFDDLGAVIHQIDVPDVGKAQRLAQGQSVAAAADQNAQVRPTVWKPGVGQGERGQGKQLMVDRLIGGIELQVAIGPERERAALALLNKKVHLNALPFRPDAATTASPARYRRSRQSTRRQQKPPG